MVREGKYDGCEFIPAKVLAEILGVDVRTVHRYKSAGKLPKPIRFGGNVRWRRQDIDDWLAGACC